MTSAIPSLQPDDYRDLPIADPVAAHVAELETTVNDLAAVVAYQNDEQTLADLKIADLELRYATVYEQARHDADARLDLCEHIVAELWRHSEDISVRDGEGTDLTLDALIDTDLPRAFAETAWAMAQVLKSPSCLVTTWLRSIDWCVACARDGHKCDVAPCGCHHDPFGCSECAEIMASAAADRERDEEKGR